MDKEFLKIFGALSVLGTITGATVGFGLSFTALSTLVIGGIVGCSCFTLLTALATISKLFNFPIFSDDVSEESDICKFGIDTIVAAGVGISLAAVAVALFPGFMLSASSAILAGEVIGGLATASSFVTHVLVANPIATRFPYTLVKYDTDSKI